MKHLLEVSGYLLGGALLLLVAGIASDGAPRYLVVGLAAGALLIIMGSASFLGSRRIFPVGVTRQDATVVCRYLPWRELNVYAMFIVMPLIGISAFTAASSPGTPSWVRAVGLLVCGVVLLAAYFVIQMWRRSLVVISPASVTVRLPARGSPLTEIPRSRITSIASADAEVGAAFAPVNVAQVALTYQPDDTGAATTVLIGPPASKTALQVSVKPTDMYRALVMWLNNPDKPPTALMDHVEQILRGRR